MGSQKKWEHIGHYETRLFPLADRLEEDLIMLAKEFVEFNRYNTKLDYGEMCELEKHIKELIDRTTDYEIRIINVETNIGEKRADELREKISSADKTLKKEMQELAKKNRLGFT